MPVRVETFWGLILGCWKGRESAENRPFVGSQVVFWVVLGSNLAF